MTKFDQKPFVPITLSSYFLCATMATLSAYEELRGTYHKLPRIVSTHTHQCRREGDHASLLSFASYRNPARASGKLSLPFPLTGPPPPHLLLDSPLLPPTAQNIERNNARLLALGLISSYEAQLSNLKARGATLEELNDVVGDGGADEGGRGAKVRKEMKDSSAPKPKRRKTAPSSSSSSGPSEPARSSLRLKGLAPDGTTVTLSIPRTASEISEERSRRVVGRTARLRAAKEVAAAGADKAAMENPTASYAHCLMRVKTMSEKALLTRVKRIENAAGKHCIVKMAVFKCCLQVRSAEESKTRVTMLYKHLALRRYHPCCDPFSNAVNVSPLSFRVTHRTRGFGISRRRRQRR